MRAVRAAVVAGAAGFGVALLALSVFHTTTVGNCASGPSPYGIAARCPTNDGYWTGALVGSLLLTMAAFWLIGGGLTTSAIFFTVGGACIAALASGDADTSWVLAAIVLAALFIPLGVAMLVMNAGLNKLLARRRPPQWSAAFIPFALIGAAGAVAAAVAIPGSIS